MSDYVSDRVFDGVRPLSPGQVAKLRANFWEIAIIDRGKEVRDITRSMKFAIHDIRSVKTVYE